MESSARSTRGTPVTGHEDTSNPSVCEEESSIMLTTYAGCLWTRWAKNPSACITLNDSTAAIRDVCIDGILLELDGGKDARGREQRMRLELPPKLVQAIGRAALELWPEIAAPEIVCATPDDEPLPVAVVPR